MNFPRLSRTTQRLAARIMGKDQYSRILYAWLPPDASTKPTTRAGYTLAAGETFPGPALAKAGEAMGLITRQDDAITITLDGLKVPWDPRAGITTVLIGTTRTTASRYQVTASRRAGGTLEVDMVPTAPLTS